MPSSTVRSPGRSARSSIGEATPSPADAPAAVSRPPTRRRISIEPAPRARPQSDRRFGIALSVALHLILLFVLLLTDAVRLPDFVSLLDESDDAAGAGERVVFLPIEEFPAARTSATPSSGPIATPAAPLVVPTPAAGPPAPVAGNAPLVPSSGGVPGAGAASATPARDRFHRALEALRPRLLDPRLRPGNAADLRTQEEVATARVYARINALNDSIMAEIEAGRRATDWTITDEQGRRWGISPGKLHLGGIEIPLPITVGTSAEQRARIREWEEIQAQSERGAIGETFDDRVDAIRDRRDAERAEE